MGIGHLVKMASAVVICAAAAASCVSEPLVDQLMPDPTPTPGPVVLFDVDGNPTTPDPNPVAPDPPALGEVCDDDVVVAYFTATGYLYGPDVRDAVTAFPVNRRWYQCPRTTATKFPTGDNVLIPTGEPQGQCFFKQTQTLRDTLEEWTAFGQQSPLGDMMEPDHILCADSQ